MTEEFPSYVWTQRLRNEWIFGEPVRGVTRSYVARVVFHESPVVGMPMSNFFWEVFQDEGDTKVGICGSLTDALYSAEKALGVIP